MRAHFPEQRLVIEPTRTDVINGKQQSSSACAVGFNPKPAEDQECSWAISTHQKYSDNVFNVETSSSKGYAFDSSFIVKAFLFFVFRFKCLGIL